jgi:hypothetical protein
MRSIMVGLLIAATASGAACHTMRPVTLGELGAMRPSEVRVTRADQSVVVVSGPQTFGDTLVGYVNGQFEEMPGVGLKQMLVRRSARGRTAALVAAGAVGIAALAALVSGAGDYRNPADRHDCYDDPEAPGCPLAP